MAACSSLLRFAPGNLVKAPLVSPLLAFLLLAGVSASPVHAQVRMGGNAVTINVRVTNESSGANLEQVQVDLVQFPDLPIQQLFTDSSGRAAFLNMEPGNYVVRVKKPGFRPTQVEIETRRGMTSFDVPIQMPPEGAASTQPGGKVSARELSIPEPARNEFHKGIDFLKQKNDPKQSIVHFQNAIDAFPGYYESYFLLGVAYLRTSQGEEAQGALQKAVDLNPLFMEPYYPLTEILMARKQFADAERLLQRAMEEDAQGWLWPYDLAMCFARQSQWDKAANYGQMALNRPSPAPKVHLLMADIYSNWGKTSKAIEELEAFKRLDPQSPYIARVDQVLPQLRQRAINENNHSSHDTARTVGTPTQP
jgi:Carboxypeptidase regulatory-like domain/Tetratricopeptide repeat